MNDLASAGAEPVGVLLTVLLPESVEEPRTACHDGTSGGSLRQGKDPGDGGHTEVTAVVNQPVISVCGVGKVKDGCLISTGGARPVWIFLSQSGSELRELPLSQRKKKTELKTKFSVPFVEKAKALDAYISVQSEAAVAVKSGVSAMHDVTEGGIFGALWEMAEASGVGLEIDLKKDTGPSGDH